MTDKAPWITYRPELRVLDCTIRDGGLINNSKFTDDQVKEANLREDSVKHLTQVGKALTLKCPPGPAS